MKDRLYTTQLQAGLGVIDDTRKLLDLWELGMKSTDLFNKSLDSGQFPGKTARRLQNLIGECFAPRYLKADDYPANALKKLCTRLTTKEFNQLLFIFTVRANPILADFVNNVYWERYAGGHENIYNEESYEFVQQANLEGKTIRPWSESTIKRVSGYLTKCCADFGLLEQGRKKVRKILSFRIEERVLAFLTHELHFSGLGDNAVIAHPDWKIFGLQKEDVRDEIKRLSLKGFFIVQIAGNVTRIGWNHKNWEEFIDVIAES